MVSVVFVASVVASAASGVASAACMDSGVTSASGIASVDSGVAVSLFPLCTPLIRCLTKANLEDVVRT